MSWCASFMPEWASERVALCSAPSAMPAARRLTAPRACTAAITPKARIATAPKTNSAIRRRASPKRSALTSSRKSMSNLEVDHAVHDEVADHHPGDRAGEDEMREVVVPHAAVEVRRDHLHDREHADRQRRQDQRGGPALGRERPDLAPHLEALSGGAGQGA